MDSEALDLGLPLDWAHATQLRRLLVEALQSTPDLIVDLRFTEVVEVAGLQLLLADLADCEGCGRTLRIYPGDAFHRAVELTGLHEVFSSHYAYPTGEIW